MNGIGNTCSTSNGVFNAVVTTATRLTMEVHTDQLGGALDTGATGTRAVTAPKTGWFGITAATGTNGQSSHIITSVRVLDCP